jgi:preprotein translocase subunit SecE
VRLEMANEKDLVKVKTKDKDKDKDLKKKGAAAAAKVKAQKQNRTTLKEYFRGVRVEMKKVVWPTPRELAMYTWTVIFTCIFFALFFWLADSVFLMGLRLALGFEFVV